jgi:hypothetical protein
VKNIFTILSALLLSTTAFSQQVDIAKWTFPTGNPVDSLADQANALNQAKYIHTQGGTSALAFKNGATTKAAQATGWDNGKDAKSWQVEVNTTGYNKIELSSKQTAGGSQPGPADFKLQYRIGTDGTWMDIPGGTLRVGNDWTTGVAASLRMPDECGNQASVYIRWVMTSNLDMNGAALLSTGISKIDDIAITGEVASGIENPSSENRTVTAYPNPCSGLLTVSSEKEIRNIEVFSITGSKVCDIVQNSRSCKFDTSGLKGGHYVLVIHYSGEGRTSVEEIIKL